MSKTIAQAGPRQRELIPIRSRLKKLTLGSAGRKDRVESHTGTLLDQLSGDGVAIEREHHEDIANLLPVRRKMVIGGIHMPRQVELF